MIFGLMIAYLIGQDESIPWKKPYVAFSIRSLNRV